jgi:signal transduction histidine kinase
MLIGAENRSLKQVLTLLFLIAVLLFTLLLTAMAAQQVFNHLKNDAISDTFQVAQRLAKDSRLAIIQMAPENAMSSVWMALDYPNIENIVLFEKHGAPLFGNSPKQVKFDDIGKCDFNAQGVCLLKETPDTIFIVSAVIIETRGQANIIKDIEETEGIQIARHRELIGYVLISLGKAELYKMRGQVWRESLLVGAMITGVFLVMLMLVLKKITSHIIDLAHFMTHPDTANNYRCAPVNGVKEIRDISSSFNALMGAFERSNKKLILSNEKLEARVFERTCALKQARDEAEDLIKENRMLISSMNSAVEEERKFIARELHDHLNAELLFVKLKLRRLKTVSTKLAVGGVEWNDSIEELIVRISNVYESSRNIVTMLRPEVMDSLGLIGAIEDRLDMFNRSQPDFEVTFEYEGDYSELSYPISIALFRIVQESLTNASKHAQATEIKIRLYLKSKKYPSGVYLCVADNGKGFDTKESSHNGVGLISMRERIFALNGQLKVESTAGQGTYVTACIPLDL